MKISGAHTLPFPSTAVWDSILDPAVLVRTIPGCERLESTGEHSYAMTVTAGVASIRGTYDGTCELSELRGPESLVMRLRGAGAAGTIDATVSVALAASDALTTTVTYDAEAVVGGMVGGVGQRLLTSVSRRMAGEFFANIQALLLAGGPRPEPEAGPDWVMTREDGAPAPGPGRLFTAPAAAPQAHDDFLRGIAVGAGLVLLGVVAGSIFGRRR